MHCAIASPMPTLCQTRLFHELCHHAPSPPPSLLPLFPGLAITDMLDPLHACLFTLSSHAHSHPGTAHPRSCPLPPCPPPQVRHALTHAPSHPALPFTSCSPPPRYGTYKLVQKMPGGERHTGFTRILHRMKEDELFEEVCVWGGGGGAGSV